MYPPRDARELAILLRISRELDIVGDVTATVDNPSELIAWALVLGDPEVVAWRARDSGHRFVHVTARRSRAPIRGWVTAVLRCEHHDAFWNALGLGQLADGDRRPLATQDLSAAWAVMPVSPTGTTPGSGTSEDAQEPSDSESA